MKCLLSELKNRNIRVILTSATIGDLESDHLSEYWIPNDVKIKELLFGGNGSPLKTNDKLLVLCDSAKLSNKGNYSLHNPEMLTEIANRIKNIINTHGIQNCKIVSKSINEAKILLKKLRDMDVNVSLGKNSSSECLQITWYKGTDTIGVASDKRVWITVGFAYKPVNRFNNVTSDIEASEKKSHLENHADFFQTIMRAKGEGRSTVFALGVTYDECVAATIWGTKRKIEVDKATHEVHVICKQYIPGPKVKECFSFEQMILESIIHMGLGKKDATSYFCEGSQSCFKAGGLDLCTDFPIRNYNGNFETQIKSRFFKEQFLNMILTDEKPGSC